MKVPGHVDMTRDAVLLTAETVRERNDARLAELQAVGVGVSPDVLVERRLAALLDVLGLDDDQRALLELGYQEKLEEWLHQPAITEAMEQAQMMARHAKLLAPPEQFHRAANGGVVRGIG